MGNTENGGTFGSVNGNDTRDKGSGDTKTHTDDMGNNCGDDKRDIEGHGGNNFATASTDAISYFSNVQKLYSLFSASPQRWAILREHVTVAPKTWSNTRWESRSNSIEALRYQASNIREALLKIREVMDRLTKVEAQSLAEEKNWLCFSSDMCEERNVEVALKEVKEKRLRSKKKYFAHEAQDEPIADAMKRLKATFFNVVVDKAIDSLTDRFGTLREVRESFGVLLSFQKVDD
ncbi:uncharacterized protein LOC135226631 [Macrobrachium nipponense]|uniref:uncharacterized protein LOC135226631 n=1 Tax=Macrobrachium nipponense TaxID=159736 RepID=UPI0030C886B8